MKSIFLPLILIIYLMSMNYPLFSQALPYPTTQKVTQEDDYFGTKVADPYRWLENDNADDTKAWVKAQNEVTFSYLEKIPNRQLWRERLEKVFNYPKYSAPFRKGEWFYFYKNDGLQNQSVLYRQKGLQGAPELVLDPNKLTADGTTRLMNFALSNDGKYAAIGTSKGGSDWHDVVVMDMATKQNLSEKLEWVKVSGLAWEGNGFYYSRYPAPEKGTELSSKNENHQVFYHKIGTPQSQDELVYEDKNNPQRFHTVYTTDDEKYAILYLTDRGKGKDGNAIFFKARGEKTFKSLIPDITNNQFSVIDNVNDQFLVQTNKNAPNDRVILIDSKNAAESAWKTVIAEKLNLYNRLARLAINFL